MARDAEVWSQASKKVIEVVRTEALARCEGTGLDRPVEEIASMALRAGGQGAMGLEMRVCPKCGDTLHPLGFTHHVKKCNGTRTKYNILTRSKTCSICGVAKRDELNLPAPVRRRRIIGKRAPGAR